MKTKLLTGSLAIVLVSSVSSVAQERSEQEQAVCKFSAEHMIEIAKQSLNEQSSRPERIEQRRKLVEDWTSRMDSGEDPCSVYSDIQKAAATF